MKNTFKSLLALTGGLIACGMLSQQAQAITLNFSSLPNGSVVTFDGAGHFSFTPGAGGAFSMAVGSGGSGTAIGDPAQMDVMWTFNAAGVVTAGNPGTLSIFDGSSTFTADLNLNVISSSTTTGFGGIGESSTATINLTNFSYPGGADPDLLSLLADGQANLNVTFQFTPGLSVGTLASTPHTTSFSVTLTSSPVPDGGSSLALLGFALLSVEGLRRKLSK